MTQFLLKEEMNLFVGDDPDASNHLTLSELALPKLEETNFDFQGGGAAFGLNMKGGGFKPLAASFKLAGVNLDVMKYFQLDETNTPFTALSAMRDQLTGALKPAKAIINGRLGTIEEDAFKKGEMSQHDYGITGIVHYELHIDGKELYYFDWARGIVRVDGVDKRAKVRSMLNIPGA